MLKITEFKIKGDVGIAKLNVKTSFTNATVTKENGVYFIEEFDTKGEVSKGKFNLSESLDSILDTAGAKLSFDTTTELEADV